MKNILILTSIICVFGFCYLFYIIINNCVNVINDNINYKQYDAIIVNSTSHTGFCSSNENHKNINLKCHITNILLKFKINDVDKFTYYNKICFDSDGCIEDIINKICNNELFHIYFYNDDIKYFMDSLVASILELIFIILSIIFLFYS